MLSCKLLSQALHRSTYQTLSLQCLNLAEWQESPPVVDTLRATSTEVTRCSSRYVNCTSKRNHSPHFPANGRRKMHLCVSHLVGFANAAVRTHLKSFLRRCIRFASDQHTCQHSPAHVTSLMTSSLRHQQRFWTPTATASTIISALTSVQFTTSY